MAHRGKTEGSSGRVNYAEEYGKERYGRNEASRLWIHIQKKFMRKDANTGTTMYCTVCIEDENEW